MAIKRLNEDTALKFQRLSPEEKKARGILGRLYGPVATFAAPTRNGRLYSQELWEKLFNSDLIKEGDNPHDRNGICVEIKGETVVMLQTVNMR